MESTFFGNVSLVSSFFPGGLLVAEKLLTAWMHSFIRVYYWGSKASWSVYTRWVKEVITADDALVQTVKYSKGLWIEETIDLNILRPMGFLSLYHKSSSMKNVSLKRGGEPW